jgi:arylsulfatase A-like enzyme
MKVSQTHWVEAGAEEEEGGVARMADTARECTARECRTVGTDGANHVRGGHRMSMQTNPKSSETVPSVGAGGLLVVTVDRLPAWMLAAYGATWVATPAIDSLAARGVVFDRLITPSPAAGDTLHGLLTAERPDGPSLLSAAAVRGWRPVVVTDDAAVAAEMTAAGSRPEVEVRLVEALAKEGSEEDDTRTNIARLVDAALETIASQDHRLVWCHVGSLGVAWDAAERYRDRYVDPEDPPPPSGARVPGAAVDADTDPDLVVGIRQVFAGQITLLDSQLGRLFAAVQESQSAASGPWTVLVVGVRGLPLGLHGWIGLGGPELPYGELIHVPAIFVDAGGRMAAQRFGGLVVPADLGATLADLLRQANGVPSAASSVDPSTPWQGASLSPLFEDWSATLRDRVVVSGEGGAALVTPAWHGLLHARGGEARTKPAADGRLRLFAKPDDFFELADVANRCANVAGPLELLLEQVNAGDRRAAWLAALPDKIGE